MDVGVGVGSDCLGNATGIGRDCGEAVRRVMMDRKVLQEFSLTRQDDRERSNKSNEVATSQNVPFVIGE